MVFTSALIAALLISVNSAVAHESHIGIENCHEDAQSGVQHCHLDSIYAHETLTGPAHAISGIWLKIGDVLVQLQGIVSFREGEQCEAGGILWNCGAAAIHTLRGIIGSGQVHCDARFYVGRIRFGQVRATCFNSAGEDISGEMVRRGLAFHDFSARDSTVGEGRPPEYNAEEVEAREKKRGLYDDLFVRRWQRSGK